MPKSIEIWKHLPDSEAAEPMKQSARNESPALTMNQRCALEVRLLDSKSKNCGAEVKEFMQQLAPTIHLKSASGKSFTIKTKFFDNEGSYGSYWTNKNASLTDSGEYNVCHSTLSFCNHPHFT